MSEMSEISPQGILAVSVSALLLFIAAWQKFNTPPTNRSGTTFALFYVGELLYFIMLVAVWLCTMAILASGGASLFNLKITAETKDLLPLVAAFLVVLASSSNYEFIKNLDEAARQFCVRLASIPLLAEQLGYELAHRASFCVVSEQLKKKITELISKQIAPKALNFKNDGSASSRFTRAVSMYWLFVEPHNTGTLLEFPVNSSSKSGYAKVMNFGEKTVSQANDQYATLMEIGVAYFTTARPIRQVEDTLRKVTQQTSNLVCSLIARFVLFQDKTLTQRRNRLLSMGFDHYDPLPAFGVTRWAVTMLIVGIITMAIVRFTPRAMPIDFTEAFLRVVVFAIQIGISIAAGTFVAQRFIRRREPTRAFLLIFELTSACLIVITMSSVVKIGGSLVSAVLSQHVSIDFGYIVGEFIDRWPAIMFPVVNTISIGVLCSYLTVLNLGRLGLAILGAICNGLAFVAAALLVGMVLPRTVLSELNVNVDAARLSIMVNSGLIGVAVGAMVLAMFRRNKPAADAHKISAPDGNGAVPSWEDTPTKGEWADKALGGYSRENTAEFEGSYVCFRPMFAKPGVINAYLMKIQWDAKQSCLTFEEGGRKDPYIQQGRIYIPNGKPFINLVTTEKGDVRLIVVCRPDAEGLARGLIMTLSVASGLSYTPASAPVVLRRLGNEEPPKLGFVHPGDTDYDLYHAQLLQVLPTYGVFGEPAVTASPEEAR